MPKTQTKRGMSPRELDALRKQFVAEQKQIDSASKWQLANDIASGINDIVGRGVIAPILGAPADIKQALWDAGAWVNNKIKDVEVATGMVKQPKYVPYSQGNARLGSEDIGNMMEQAGLVSSERRPLTEFAASMIGPSVIENTVLNAPKITRNMLRMIDNLEAPQSRWVRLSDGRLVPRNQLGAITVWHGSDKEYDTYKAMDKIGSGQGQQAYGLGGYHTSDEDVAKWFRDDAVSKNLKRETSAGFIKNIYALYPPDEAYQLIKKRYGNKADSLIEEANKITGNLYKNELAWNDPAKEIADPLSDTHFIDWEKPIKEQSEYVKSQLKTLYKDEDIGLDIKNAVKYNYTGKDVYNLIHRLYGNETPQKLFSSGFPGMSYADDIAQKQGKDARSYVTFSDDLVNILERNGVPVTAPQPGLKK